MEIIFQRVQGPFHGQVSDILFVVEKAPFMRLMRRGHVL
jgi:hypothetical protein